MRTEHRQISNNVLQTIRADRGKYDLVFDAENRGWYLETIINGVTMRSKTYQNAQEAEVALKKKKVLCNIPVSQA